MKKKINIKKVTLIIVFVLLIVLFFPYVKAEFLTARYSDEFDDGYEQTGMIDEVEYFRVIEYNDREAVVCYIEKNHASLSKIWFERNNDDTWKEVGLECIWSKTGSADKFCWPYYR